MQELFNKICKNQSLNIIVSAPLNAYMESLVSWEAIVYVMSRHLASQIKHFANKFSIQYNLAQVGREDNFITVGNNHNLQNFYKMDKVRNQNLGRQQKTALVITIFFKNVLLMLPTLIQCFRVIIRKTHNAKHKAQENNLFYKVLDLCHNFKLIF